MRRQFLLTRALLRTTLSRYRPHPPQRWRFVANRYGRPAVAEPPCALNFNLSHTHGLVVCAVSGGRTVGVDVEYLDRNTDTAGIAERFFSASETAALLALPAAAQRERFFAYWTLKESYMKARGMGLALPLGQFSFELDETGGRIGIRFGPQVDDRPERWRFWRHRPGPAHRLALCVERRDDDPPLQVSLRRTLPLTDGGGCDKP